MNISRHSLFFFYLKNTSHEYSDNVNDIRSLNINIPILEILLYNIPKYITYDDKFFYPIYPIL